MPTHSPATVLARLKPRLDEQLEALAKRDQDIFWLRLKRYLPDLMSAYQVLYDQHANMAEQLDALIESLALHYRDRSDNLKVLDLERELTPDWFQQQQMIGYVFYVDRFNHDINGILKKRDYLIELGVSYVHLMKIIKPRQGENDGGFAVADYRDVDPQLGTVEDLAQLCEALRQDGISVCIDLVLNHCADEHEWVAKARAGDERYQHYFHLYPDRTMPDQFERSLPEVFPDFAPGNFSFDPTLKQWVWTTFNRYQWDLNYSNPQVMQEIVDILCYWANKGVEVFRLDAVAFMWKRLGTDSQNQPEVFEILQVLQMCSRIVSPAVIHKAEAIVPPQHLIRYLGQAKHVNKVSQVAYHNSLMVHYWSALASRDSSLMTYVLTKFPDNPRATSWATYLRCHDDIGWAINDNDAAMLNLSGFGHRSFLSDFYAGIYPGSHARGEVFQFNPVTGDRRISGSLASLNGLELGLLERNESLIDNALKRTLLGYALILSFGGLPLLYMADEIGMLNDKGYLDDASTASDNRWLHRPSMDWEKADRRHQPGVEQLLFSGIQTLIQRRQSLPYLHAGVATHIVNLHHPRLFAFVRPHPIGSLLAIFNITEQAQQCDLGKAGLERYLGGVDALSQTPIPQQGAKLKLAPYQYLWLLESEES